MGRFIKVMIACVFLINVCFFCLIGCANPVEVPKLSPPNIDNTIKYEISGSSIRAGGMGEMSYGLKITLYDKGFFKVNYGMFSAMASIVSSYQGTYEINEIPPAEGKSFGEDIIVFTYKVTDSEQNQTFTNQGAYAYTLTKAGEGEELSRIYSKLTVSLHIGPNVPSSPFILSTSYDDACESDYLLANLNDVKEKKLSNEYAAYASYSIDMPGMGVQNFNYALNLSLYSDNTFLIKYSLGTIRGSYTGTYQIAIGEGQNPDTIKLRYNYNAKDKNDKPITEQEEVSGTTTTSGIKIILRVTMSLPKSAKFLEANPDGFVFIKILPENQ